MIDYSFWKLVQALEDAIKLAESDLSQAQMMFSLLEARLEEELDK